MLKFFWKQMGNDKGFSLLELIVVIVIMGVLAAIIVPNVSAMVEKSRIAADEQTAAVIARAAMLVVADEINKPAASSLLTGVLPTTTGNLSVIVVDENATTGFAGAVVDLCQKPEQMVLKSNEYKGTANKFVVIVDEAGDVEVHASATSGANLAPAGITSVSLWPK